MQPGINCNNRLYKKRYKIIPTLQIELIGQDHAIYSHAVVISSFYKTVPTSSQNMSFIVKKSSEGKVGFLLSYSGFLTAN